MEKQTSSPEWIKERLESYKQGRGADAFILIPAWKLDILTLQLQEMHQVEIKAAYIKGAIENVNLNHDGI